MISISLHFSAGVKAPFNWLTQSSLDTFADYSMSSTETQSSLLFTVGSNRGGLPKSTNVPRSRLTGPRSGFGQSIPRPISAGKQGSSKNGQFLYKIRFLNICQKGFSRDGQFLYKIFLLFIKRIL